MLGELKKYTPSLMEYVISVKDFIQEDIPFSKVKDLQGEIEDLLFNRIEKEFPKWHGNVLVNTQMISIFSCFKNFKFVKQSEEEFGKTSTIYKGGYLVKSVKSEVTENISITVETAIEIPIYCDPYLDWTDNRLILI